MNNHADWTRLMTRVRACAACDLPLGPRPILSASPTARLLITSQAPGRRAHEAGRTFADASGDRLRAWLGLTPEPHLASVVVRLVVDLSGTEPARMPQPKDLVERLAGIDLPRLTVPGRAGDERTVVAALRLFMDEG